MTVLVAIGHVVGALIALIAFGFGVLAISAWETERNRKAALEEMSLALGLTIDELDNPENQERVLQFAAARFSSELFRNRLSDLGGFIQTVWAWLGNLIQAGVVLGVIWYSVTDTPSNAIHAWWIVAIAIFFWISSIAFALLCKLLTGRFPGQARQARKLLAGQVGKHRANSD